MPALLDLIYRGCCRARLAEIRKMRRTVRSTTSSSLKWTQLPPRHREEASVSYERSNSAAIALADLRTFRAAATELNMSPPALSWSVASLEARLGVRLFNRTTRSVVLSEAGEQFLARIRPAMQQISEATDAVSAFRDTPTGTLRDFEHSSISQRP